MSTGIRGKQQETAWTHPSVRALGDQNLIGVIQERARSKVAEASAKGWSGPPFDPFELADLWGIRTVPRDDLRDARLIAEAGNLMIEYNPNRPVQRVRFSVAHELAHALFPDAASEPRHRLLSEERRGDEWQLELLCNVAAAELLMPADAFPDLAAAPLEIEKLLELRQKYEVSTEALVLRVVDRSSEPAAAVAAARLEDESGPLFRLDYLAENNLSLGVGRGATIDSRVLARCTAVGFTNSGIEVWGGSPLHVQAIGIPAYPGDLF
ncbi:MAG: ImmA/IrrE family metallo-endopeptidase, partial [Actinomycetota bacterium]